MASQTTNCLGILDLDRGLPPGATPSIPRPGSLMSSLTFDVPVISETVAGARADVVMRGDPGLEPAYVAAARRLVDRGAIAISSNCGFSIRHQAAVAASVNVPVVMSSLILAPALLRQLPPAAKLAIVTADSRQFSEDLLGVDDPAERARIVVGGIEGSTFYRNVMMCPPQPTDLADIEKDVATSVAQLRAVHPDVAALLVTCTALPMAMPAIRRMTGLPVYDITTVCRLALASVT